MSWPASGQDMCTASRMNGKGGETVPDWDEYVRSLLDRKTEYDDVVFSFGGRTELKLPPMLKATNLMLDSMIDSRLCNVLVFPERSRTMIFFLVCRLIHNVALDRIGHGSAVSELQPGQKLKLYGCIVSLEEIQPDDDGTMMVKLRFADLIETVPLASLPPLQKVSTQKGVCKYQKYALARKRAKAKAAEAEQAGTVQTEAIIGELQASQTYMKSSIIFVSSVVSAKDLLGNLKVCGKRLQDIVLIGQATSEGEVTNMFPGQLSGIQAIVVAPDLSSAAAVARSGWPVQSVIISGTSARGIADSLDSLDELRALKVSVTVGTDTATSFDLQPLWDRGFGCWRWDSATTPESLCRDRSLVGRRADNCRKQKVTFAEAENAPLFEACRCLDRHSGFRDMPAQQAKIFSRLFDLLFSAIRTIVPVSAEVRAGAQKNLEELEKDLEAERRFMSEDMYQDGLSAVRSLMQVWQAPFQKCDLLRGELLRRRPAAAVIIVPDRISCSEVQAYWQTETARMRLRMKVTAVHPANYASDAPDALTVVAGWLRQGMMQKILFSYETKENLVLLYSCERKWQRWAARRWGKAMAQTENNETVRELLSGRGNAPRISFPSPEVPGAGAGDQQEDLPGEADSIDDLEQKLRENRYREYSAGGSSGSGSRDGTRQEKELAEAVPVDLAGDYVIFCRSGHHLTDVTDIVLSGVGEAREIRVSELKPGHFIAIRESDPDLVRTVADGLMASDGAAGLRSTAAMWRTALNPALLAYSAEEICGKIAEAGCSKGKATVRNWIVDEDMICPGDRDDLRCIADVTGDDALKDRIDEVFDAAVKVRSYHSRAGKTITKELKKHLTEAMDTVGGINPAGVTEPIEITMEDIGLVRVLKVLEIREPGIFSSGDTDRLIEL